MSFTVYGTVKRVSDHGSHRTVVIAPDLGDDRNTSWSAEGDLADSELVVKVNPKTGDLPELAEGAAVTIGFSTGSKRKSTAAPASPETPPAQ